MATQRQTSELTGHELWAEDTLSVEEAARFLHVSKSWLKRKRCIGGGPPYRQFTKRNIVYVRRDLIAWRDEKLRTCTLEYRDPPHPQLTAAASEALSSIEEDS